MTMLAQTITHVRTGADRLLSEARDLISGKRLGILTNHTGRLSDGRLLVDAAVGSGLCEVTALFGPEHGVSGDAPDGSAVDHSKHPKHGIPIFSLYGKTHKPTPEMLSLVDAIVCDIQDVGARFYTFISTVALALEAAAEHNIPFILLDRPNPIRGMDYDGPVRVPQLRSFVGWMPIPVTHGMTLGELARLWNAQGWLQNGVKANLQVVPVEGWRRTMWYDETSLPWIAPSPNMPRLSTATVYPGICFLEGTSISEGRGTDAPFELVGAPWADPQRILKELSSFAVPGVEFSPEEFVPKEIPGAAKNPKYEGQVCRGIRVGVRDRDRLKPVRLGIAILAAFKRSHPEETVLRYRRFDILTGSPEVRTMLVKGLPPDEICEQWTSDLKAFGALRRQYLLYD